jgi:hypothetical protein
VGVQDCLSPQEEETSSGEKGAKKKGKKKNLPSPEEKEAFKTLKGRKIRRGPSNGNVFGSNLGLIKIILQIWREFRNWRNQI